MALTPEEMRAIASLKRLAKRWPPSLWLFSASGSLLVMCKGPDGEHVHAPGGEIDANYIVDHIIGIENDGGDF